MLETFHKQLPDATFVVMSGLLLPGRSEYTDLTKKINDALEALCDELDYAVFVDAAEMTYDGENYDMSLFTSDGIHLNRAGQLEWCNKFIRPQLEAIISAHRLEDLRK